MDAGDDEVGGWNHDFEFGIDLAPAGVQDVQSDTGAPLLHEPPAGGPMSVHAHGVAAGSSALRKLGTAGQISAACAGGWARKGSSVAAACARKTCDCSAPLGVERLEQQPRDARWDGKCLQRLGCGTTRRAYHNRPKILEMSKYSNESWVRLDRTWRPAVRQGHSATRNEGFSV